MIHRSVPSVRGLIALIFNIHELLCIGHSWLKVGNGAGWTVIHKGKIMHARFLVHAFFSILPMLTRPLTSVMCFLVQTKRKLLLWLWNSACMTPSQLLCSLNSSALFDSTTKNFSLYTLLVCFLATFHLSFVSFDIFPSPLVHRLFSNLLCLRGPYTPTFFSQPISSAHLFFSFIIPPQLFLSHCLYSFWQAYVREVVVKSITIVLHRAISGGVTRQMSVEIYWCPSSLLYFFMLSATALVASLTKGVFQTSDVTVCPPQGCDTCCKRC